MHSNNFPDCFYRVSVKGMYTQENRVLLLRNFVNGNTQWELPGGGLKFGEDPITGLKREFREELNLEPISISTNPVYVWTRKFENWRNLDWFYSIVLAYEVNLAILDAKSLETYESIGFFDLKALQSLNLCQQSARLKEVFSAKDCLRKF